jgi:predicted DNA-binding WGR domain protein
MEIESTQLEFREGNSDKVYTATIMENDGGHHVVFLYGRRHNLTGRIVKPSSGSVSYQEARGIYKDMIDKKLKKGYVPMS